MVEEEKTVRIKGKVCLLGDPAVGKTSLIRRFVFDSFKDKYISTVGTKITRKALKMEHPDPDKEIDLTLMIWDIMGRDMDNLSSSLSQYEKFIPPKNFFRNAKGAIIVCDITREDTYTSLTKWYTKLSELSGNVPIIIIGNKADLLHETDFEITKINKLACSCNSESLLTSAKTGKNVEKMFFTIGDYIVNDALNWEK